MTPQQYLEAIRKKGKLTQAQIAEKTGITQGQISKLERGEVEDVLSKTYLALQALYDELGLWDGVSERRTNPPCCEHPAADDSNDSDKPSNKKGR